MRPLVLDTNIVLDLFVFDDPVVQPLKKALQEKSVEWLATADMRDELLRVLGYPKIMLQLARFQIDAAHVMSGFDAHARIVPSADLAPVLCSDADDQKFLDLAVAYQAELISKDDAVLSLTKPLAALGVRVHSVWVN
jgi:putative PIN family toxin of toxin-antitoxin system